MTGKRTLDVRKIGNAVGDERLFQHRKGLRRRQNGDVAAAHSFAERLLDARTDDARLVRLVAGVKEKDVLRRHGLLREDFGRKQTAAQPLRLARQRARILQKRHLVQLLADGAEGPHALVRIKTLFPRGENARHALRVQHRRANALKCLFCK